MKSLKFLFMFFAFALVIVGCSNNNEDNDLEEAEEVEDSEDTILIWDISTGIEKEIVEQEVEKFNSEHDDMQAKVEFFQNDPYKQKLQVAMGADEVPDIFYGWGGGILESYVSADKVYDLTEDLEDDSEWNERYLESIMEPATFDDEVYGVPNTKLSPAAFNYNKEVFEELGLDTPETWDEFLEVVETLKDNDVVPIALANKDVWPGLMYYEYLVDRIGGPEVFQKVVDGEEGAWSDPAFIEANEKIQELAEMGAFQEGFESVEYEGGTADALLYTGEAGMQLDLSTGFTNILDSSPEFIENGNFGWFEFPEIEDGEGDPDNIVGNPSNFYSISENSTKKEEAIEYLKDYNLNEESTSEYVDAGEVPPVAGIDSELEEQKYGDWLEFNYEITDEAPHFQMSWDQTLPPKEANQLLENLDEVFNGTMTPDEFSEDMNEYIE